MRSPITPHLWFDTLARVAADFYCSIVPDSKMRSVTPRPAVGRLRCVSFALHGQSCVTTGAGPLFNLNPSAASMVNVDRDGSLTPQPVRALMRKRAVAFESINGPCLPSRDFPRHARVCGGLFGLLTPWQSC